MKGTSTFHRGEEHLLGDLLGDSPIGCPSTLTPFQPYGTAEGQDSWSIPTPKTISTIHSFPSQLCDSWNPKSLCSIESYENVAMTLSPRVIGTDAQLSQGKLRRLDTDWRRQEETQLVLAGLVLILLKRKQTPRARTTCLGTLDY